MPDDSEDDGDYIPTANDGVDSESSSDNDEPDTKRAKVLSDESSVDPVEEQEKRDALWAKFQASDDSSDAQKTQVRKVKIEKRYLFAGETVIEVVEVPEDSQDAKKWPLWTDQQAIADEAPSKPSAPAKKAGPRKGKLKLGLIPTIGQKAKKLSTLDKSAMDWNAHLASSGSNLADELEANRRTGGYLEKVDFLQRVGDRREEALEANKAGKRKRS